MAQWRKYLWGSMPLYQQMQNWCTEPFSKCLPISTSADNNGYFWALKRGQFHVEWFLNIFLSLDHFKSAVKGHSLLWNLLFSQTLKVKHLQKIALPTVEKLMWGHILLWLDLKLVILSVFILSVLEQLSEKCLTKHIKKERKIYQNKIYAPNVQHPWGKVCKPWSNGFIPMDMWAEKVKKLSPQTHPHKSITDSKFSCFEYE